MEELIYGSASKLADSIRQKQASSEEVVRACLQRIEEVNPSLNAVVQVAHERALLEARQADEALARGQLLGPLHGVPMTIKDSLDTAGIISTGGTTGRDSFVPEQDATAVARMRAAGAILLGKTNTPEMTLGGETNNLIYGRTSNPYDLTKTTGGSSGGAGSIIAAGGSPIDLGSDTAGSVRLPAHFCGIAGLKPNSGRVPRTGHIIPFGLGAVDSFTQVGPMARYVQDLRLVLPIIAGVDWIDPSIVPMHLGDPHDVDLKGLRVAVHTYNDIATTTPETTDAVRAAARALEDAGLTIEEEVPAALKRSRQLYDDLVAADGRAWVRRLLEEAGTTEFHPWIADALEAPLPISAGEFSALLGEMDRFRSDMLSFIEKFDVVLCPVAISPAFDHGGWPELDTIPYTCAYNLTGWPGASVRAGTSPEGLPIGVQVVGRPWREDVVLAVAQQIETSLGGWQRPPL